MSEGASASPSAAAAASSLTDDPLVSNSDNSEQQQQQQQRAREFYGTIVIYIHEAVVGRHFNGFVRLMIDGKKGPRTYYHPELQWNQKIVIPIAGRLTSIGFYLKEKIGTFTSKIGVAYIGPMQIAQGLTNDKLGLLDAVGYISISVCFISVEDFTQTESAFPERKNCRVSLYQDAHLCCAMPGLDLFYNPEISSGNAFEDMYDAMMNAKHLIYITGWSLWTKLNMVRRYRNEEGGSCPLTLGDLLKKKAANGVRVLVLLWDDVLSMDNSLVNGLLPQTKSGVMNVHDEETKKFFDDVDFKQKIERKMVHCQLAKRETSGVGRENASVGLESTIVHSIASFAMFTHHQKTLICDTDKGCPPGKSRLIAFLGGLDMTDGRWDSPKHSIFTYPREEARNMLQELPDKKPYLQGFDPVIGPREPWHDIHCRVEGAIAYDVLQNFEQRWRKQSVRRNRNLLLHLSNEKFIVEGEDVFNQDDSWSVQLFRSIDSNSAEFSNHGSNPGSLCGYLRCDTSGMWVHPHGGEGKVGVRMLLHHDPAFSRIRLNIDHKGRIRHVKSGLFVHAEDAAVPGASLVLHEEHCRSCRHESTFEIKPNGTLMHIPSKLIVDVLAGDDGERYLVLAKEHFQGENCAEKWSNGDDSEINPSILRTASLSRRSLSTSCLVSDDICCGWLMKEGVVGKLPHRRWFELHGSTLYYFARKPETEKEREELLKGSVSLTNCKVRDPKSSRDQPFCFRVDLDPRYAPATRSKYILIADSKRDMNTWKEAMTVAAAKMEETTASKSGISRMQSATTGLFNSAKMALKAAVTVDSSSSKDQAAAQEHDHHQHRVNKPCRPFGFIVHAFDNNSFFKPTHCHVCSKILVGTVASGICCSQCGILIHAHCAKAISGRCEKLSYLDWWSFEGERSLDVCDGACSSDSSHECGDLYTITKRTSTLDAEFIQEQIGGNRFYSSSSKTIVERGIQDAYIAAIRKAKRFIYIENQFFLGSSTEWKSYNETNHNYDCKNRVPAELAYKIVTKIRNKERFCCYILLPLHPEGDAESAAVQDILFWQFQTVEMMYEKIAKALIEVDSSDHPTDYLVFLTVGNRESKFHFENDNARMEEAQRCIPRQQRMLQSKRNMIYVHSKMMIVDDVYIIVGSANINERSMAGDRDTEIAAGMHQPKISQQFQDNPDIVKSGDVHKFRMSLWVEHTAPHHDIPVFLNPESMQCAQAIKEIGNKNWNIFDGPDCQDLPSHLMCYPYEISFDGTVKPKRECFPDCLSPAKIVGTRSAAIPQIITT